MTRLPRTSATIWRTRSALTRSSPAISSYAQPSRSRAKIRFLRAALPRTLSRRPRVGVCSICASLLWKNGMIAQLLKIGILVCKSFGTSERIDGRRFGLVLLGPNHTVVVDRLLLLLE